MVQQKDVDSTLYRIFKQRGSFKKKEKCIEGLYLESEIQFKFLQNIRKEISGKFDTHRID